MKLSEIEVSMEYKVFGGLFLFLFIWFSIFIYSANKEIKEKKAKGHIDFTDLCIDQNIKTKEIKLKLCE